MNILYQKIFAVASFFKTRGKLQKCQFGNGALGAFEKEIPFMESITLINVIISETMQRDPKVSLICDFIDTVYSDRKKNHLKT